MFVGVADGHVVCAGCRIATGIAKTRSERVYALTLASFEVCAVTAVKGVCSGSGTSIVENVDVAIYRVARRREESEERERRRKSGQEGTQQTQRIGHKDSTEHGQKAMD